MGRHMPLTTIFVLAVFAATGGIIWLAFGDTGNVVGEPPLIRASAVPLKQAPDDPGGRKVAELGGVSDLLVDQPEGVTEERLMPTPEQPLSPAEAAVASLADGGTPEGLTPNPEERGKAKAALEALISELSSGDAPSGVGGPPTGRLPTPSRPRDDGVAGQPRNSDIALQPNEPESRTNPDLSSGEVQLVAVGDEAANGDGARFQSVPGGQFRVQLAAVREESDARRAWSLFQEQLGAYVGGLEPFFEMAETSNGTFYRVQIGPFADSGEANSLCVELKKQDVSCFVVSR